MNHLERILASKRADLSGRIARTPLAEMRARAADMPPARGFLQRLRNAHDRKGLALIAEVKRASPSQGLIREEFDPVAIAESYRRAGADCLSVLTDVRFFQGAPEHLAACREASGVPVLRKDFTVDVYDVFESRALGADAVLLIVHGLSDAQLREYREAAESLGMDALVEAHTLGEAERALASGAALVGVNNRDLETFETRIDVAESVIPSVSDRAFVVSESALHSRRDVERVRKAGAGAVLIGTAFCGAPDVESKVREVMGW